MLQLIIIVVLAMGELCSMDAGAQREMALKVSANECYATNFVTDENVAYGHGGMLETPVVLPPPVPEDHPYATVDAYLSENRTADEHYETIPD